jgi:hypothetical protein
VSGFRADDGLHVAHRARGPGRRRDGGSAHRAAQAIEPTTVDAWSVGGRLFDLSHQALKPNFATGDRASDGAQNPQHDTDEH